MNLRLGLALCFSLVWTAPAVLADAGRAETIRGFVWREKGAPSYLRVRIPFPDAKPTNNGRLIAARAEDSSATLLIEKVWDDKTRGREVWILGRTSNDLPTKITVTAENRQRRVDVEWREEIDPGVVERWRDAVERFLSGLRPDSRFNAFRRYAEGRLNPNHDFSSGTSFRDAQRLARRRTQELELVTARTAIEESLQLDRLRGTGRNRNAQATVPIDTVRAVEVRSHPWKKMLNGRDPKPRSIEHFLPHDQYAFEAQSFASLLEIADWIDERGAPLVQLMEQSANDSGVKSKIETQLCLPATALSRKLGPVTIASVAATGKDPFLREGTDLTVVFELKAPPLFFANLEKNRLLARKRHKDLRRGVEHYHGHEIHSVRTPLREVSSYSVQVENYAIVSNSPVGIRRVLDAKDGRRESQASLLGRKFVRTLLPHGKGEDGFVYLSDPFIRYLVGPELRLKESRRLECSTSLSAISHSTAWRHLRGAKPAQTLEELVAENDLNPALLYCPENGEHSLLADRRGGRCSVHGHLDFLTPNAELRLDYITEEEHKAYEQFRVTYQRYWRQFFDPIAVKIEFDGHVKKFDTVILPLIDLSGYRQLSELFGGEGTQNASAGDPSEDSA
ncbi:MAG: hypothetical protein AAF517_09340, partial [Planctomycetota bacterium]